MILRAECPLVQWARTPRVFVARALISFPVSALCVEVGFPLYARAVRSSRNQVNMEGLFLYCSSAHRRQPGHHNL